MRVLANLIRSREIPASFSSLTVFLSDLRNSLVTCAGTGECFVNGECECFEEILSRVKGAMGLEIFFMNNKIITERV